MVRVGSAANLVPSNLTKASVILATNLTLAFACPARTPALTPASC